jgi:hypothetical protein
LLYLLLSGICKLLSQKINLLVKKGDFLLQLKSRVRALDNIPTLLFKHLNLLILGLQFSILILDSIFQFLNAAEVILRNLPLELGDLSTKLGVVLVHVLELSPEGLVFDFG